MRLRPSSIRKSIFGAFRAQGTCLVAANVSVNLSEIEKLKQIWLFRNALYTTLRYSNGLDHATPAEVTVS